MARPILKTFTERLDLHLTPDQRRRMEAVCKITEQNFAVFVREAVMMRVAEIEEDVRLSKERGDRGRVVAKKRPEPSGLGLRFVTEIPLAPAPAPAAQPVTIVVQTPATPTAPATNVEALVSMVMSKSDPFERNRYHELTRDLVRQTAANPIEAQKTIADLDARIEKQSRVSTPEDGGFWGFLAKANEKR